MTEDKIVIEMNGPGGNAFHLLGLAGKLARATGVDGDAITAEMTSGNYDHLVKTFVEHFGEFVELAY